MAKPLKNPCTECGKARWYHSKQDAECRKFHGQKAKPEPCEGEGNNEKGK